MNNCLSTLTEWTWDWPLDSHEGEVHCRVRDGRFYAEFIFADLRPEKVPVFTFDNLKSNCNSYTIGLCPISEKNYPVFCRLEIQAIPIQKLIDVYAYRELFRYEQAVGTVPRNMGPLVKRTRKAYRLPDEVKMETLKIRVCDQGVVQIEAELQVT